MTIRQKESFRELSIFNVLPCFYRNKLEQIRIIGTFGTVRAKRSLLHLCRVVTKVMERSYITLNSKLSTLRSTRRGAFRAKRGKNSKLFPYSPLARCVVNLESIAVVEFTFGAFEGDGEDDDLRVWKVGIHPTVTHIEISCLLRATDDEDGGGLCAIGYGVADVAQGNPTIREIMRIRHLTLVRCPTRTGGVEHEVEVGIAFLLGRNTHDGRCLAPVALEEWRVGDGCEVVVAQAEQSKIGVLFDGGDEVGCAIVVDKHITVTTLDAHRPSRPHELIIAA